MGATLGPALGDVRRMPPRAVVDRGRLTPRPGTLAPHRRAGAIPGRTPPFPGAPSTCSGFHLRLAHFARCMRVQGASRTHGAKAPNVAQQLGLGGRGFPPGDACSPPSSLRRTSRCPRASTAQRASTSSSGPTASSFAHDAPAPRTTSTPQQRGRSRQIETPHASARRSPKRSARTPRSRGHTVVQAAPPRAWPP